jgi:hypothetical protein
MGLAGRNAKRSTSGPPLRAPRKAIVTSSGNEIYGREPHRHPRTEKTRVTAASTLRKERSGGGCGYRAPMVE